MKVLRSRSFALRGARRRDELATWLKTLQLEDTKGLLEAIRAAADRMRRDVEVQDQPAVGWRVVGLIV